MSALASRHPWSGVGQMYYDDTPQSINHGGAGSRRHWSVAAREKKRWEQIYTHLLLLEGFPRGMDSCEVSVNLRFRDKRRRDPENYRPAVVKPLADALVKGGWLADDTDNEFRVTRFGLIHGCDDLMVHPGAKSMTVIALLPSYPA